jgi:quinol-cytochrome oxidoreductase complex cytochrome b subunit
MGLIIIHLILLHFTRRRSPLFIHERFTKIKFTPYFSVKDFLNFSLIFIFIRFSFFFPWSLGDSEN